MIVDSVVADGSRSDRDSAQAPRNGLPRGPFSCGLPDGCHVPDGVRPPDRAEAEAIRAFLLLGRHRLTAQPSARHWDLGQRYEDTRVALSLARLQRRCLARFIRLAGASLVGGLDREIQRQATAAKRIGRWLSPRAREAAEARAEKRRNAAVAEVKAERRIESANLKAESEPRTRRCTATTKRGTRCKVAPAGGQTLCATHARLQARKSPTPPTPKVTAYAGTAVARDEPSPVAASPRPARLSPEMLSSVASSLRFISPRPRSIASRLRSLAPRLAVMDAGTARAVAAAVGAAVVLSLIGSPASEQSTPASAAAASTGPPLFVDADRPADRDAKPGDREAKRDGDPPASTPGPTEPITPVASPVYAPPIGIPEPTAAAPAVPSPDSGDRSRSDPGAQAPVAPPVSNLEDVADHTGVPGDASDTAESATALVGEALDVPTAPPGLPGA